MCFNIWSFPNFLLEELHMENINNVSSNFWNCDRSIYSISCIVYILLSGSWFRCLLLQWSRSVSAYFSWLKYTCIRLNLALSLYSFSTYTGLLKTEENVLISYRAVSTFLGVKEQKGKTVSIYWALLCSLLIISTPEPERDCFTDL